MGAATFDGTWDPAANGLSSGGSPTGRTAAPRSRHCQEAEVGLERCGSARDREPETRKTASGSYPGRPSNSAPDEGDGTRTARGFPPAWRLRPDRRRQTEGERACDRRACACYGCSESPRSRGPGWRDSGHRPDATAARVALRPRPQDRGRPSAKAPAFLSRCSGGRGSRNSCRTLLRGRPPMGRLLRVDAPHRSGIQLVARLLGSRKILNQQTDQTSVSLGATSNAVHLFPRGEHSRSSRAPPPGFQARGRGDTCASGEGPARWRRRGAAKLLGARRGPAVLDEVSPCGVGSVPRVAVQLRR
jgi:hypothetical protein